MSPSRPETAQAAEAKKRIDAAATARDKAIEDAHRTYWSAVLAEIDAKTLTQTAVAAHLDFSREHVRKQIKRYVG